MNRKKKIVIADTHPLDNTQKSWEERQKEKDALRQKKKDATLAEALKANLRKRKAQKKQRDQEKK